MVLKILALIIMGVLIAVTIWLIVLLGSMPGKIAKQRGHPQADAIRILGWVGVFTLGIAWFVALVWAYTRPNDHSENDPQFGERLATLEDQFHQLDAERGQP